MHPQHPISKEEVISQCRQYYKGLIQQIKPTAFALNVSLASNPFLRDREAFKFLKFQLGQYNKRIKEGKVRDSYEMLSYQRLHSMLSDLAQIGTRQDQLTALDELHCWFKEQSRLVQQRVDQGYIRYKMSKELRDFQKVPQEKYEEEEEEELNIPFYMIERVIDPYRRHWRTLHNEFANPDKRLLEYKRKTINIATFAQLKEELKPPRVLYPVPPKYEEPKQQNEEQKPADGAEQAQGQPPPNEQAPIEGQAPTEGAVVAQDPANQPDMGGFGEEPDEPEEEEPEDVPDKLKPKNPLYVDAIQSEREKKYKESFMFYQGNENKTDRNMELRYLRRYQDILRRQREDQAQIEIAHDWAKRKAKVGKDLHKRLEDMKLNPNFTYSKESPPAEQRLSHQDEAKFGFAVTARARTRNNEFDLSMNDQLPRIGSTPFQQKTIRRDRLQSLRGKFGKLLNLAQHEDRDTTSSLCQVTSRRRGLSQIIRNHSHSKQRLNQLQEVSKIKEKLTRAKVNLNIKVLSRGLCLPQEEDKVEGEFPEKQLPSNPDMIEKKKKKKK